MFMISALIVGAGAGKNVFVKVPSGKITLGKPANFPSYGWDNEYGQVEIE